jgi:hypothetical protein
VKKLFFVLALALIALISTSASAQLTATSSPVQLKAIVPEYLGLNAVNTSPVIFDLSTASIQTQQQLADGYTNIMSIAPSAPTWTMDYNLNHRTVTVCAYASDLVGVGPTVTSSAGKIPAVFINGTSVQATANDSHGYVWFGANANCTGGTGAAVLLDQISGATSSFNTLTGHTRPEGFSLLQININPGNHMFGSTGLVPAPGTYFGTLYIVAQAI